jgi:class 3 adenylate cyclase
MNTRLAAVAFLDGQRPAGPVHRSIMAVDLEGSTMRTNPVKGELRRVIYDLLGRSLEAVGITRNRLEPLIDRGDGVLALIRPHDDVPKTVLLDQLIPLLTTLLTEYNAQASQPALQIRLRVVVHAGEVHADRRGFYGEAIDVAIRLLDSAPVKKALKQAEVPLVLVVSGDIYSGIVCQGYVAADTYFPLVQVRVANRRHRGYVHVPAPAAAPDALRQLQPVRDTRAAG